MYIKMDVELNNQEMLICHKTHQTNHQTINLEMIYKPL